MRENVAIGCFRFFGFSFFSDSPRGDSGFVVCRSVHKFAMWRRAAELAEDTKRTVDRRLRGEDILLFPRGAEAVQTLTQKFRHGFSGTA